MALTTMHIARRFMAAFAKNAVIKDWAQTNYGKPFSMFINADPRRKPTEQAAPYIIIFTDGYESGSQSLRRAHALGVMVGVKDDKIVPNPEGGPWLELRGLLRLSDELVPELETIMRSAVSGAKLQELSVEFADINFPLLQAIMNVTVEESLPVGGRNS
jgi:hypothetical protein